MSVGSPQADYPRSLRRTALQRQGPTGDERVDANNWIVLSRDVGHRLARPKKIPKSKLRIDR